MSFSDELIKKANEQWLRWGGPTVKIDGTSIGFTDKKMEAVYPYWTYVGEYWHAVHSDLDGRDPPAWSAAFISYCFKTAEAGDRFPYNENHSLYVAQIDAGRFAGLSLKDPSTTPIAIGDLLWASRSGDGCRPPPHSFAAAREELAKIRARRAGSFCSHCDIVTAVRNGEADVIGGNVKQAVTRFTYRLDVDGHVRDGRRSFIGVIRNEL